MRAQKPTSGGSPGPLRRALRSRLTTASTALLALSLIASAGTGTAASAQLQGLLDDNWRGLYDLLVTAPGSEVELEGLISPSALGALETRMTLDDLATVAGIEGVEVAAPLGSVTVDTEFGATGLYVSAPITPGDTVEDPHGYRLTLTYTSDDGLGERVIDQVRVGISFDDADLPTVTPMTPEQAAQQQGTCWVDGVGYTEPSPEAPECFVNLRFPMEVVGSNGQGNATTTIEEGQVVAALQAVPVVPSTITLVDPAAEQTLLGGEGAFLQPLADLGGSEQTYQTLADHFESAPNARTDAIEQEAEQQSARLQDVTGPDGEIVQELQGVIGNRDPLPVLPVLTAPVQQGSLRLSVRVESGFDAPEDGGIRGVPRSVFGEEPGTLVREYELDASTLLDPFGTDAIVLPMLGDDAPRVGPDELEPMPGIVPAGSAVTAALPFTSQGDGVAVMAEEYLDPRLLWDARGRTLFSPSADGTAIGAQSMYRQIVEQYVDVPQSLEGMPAVVPIADYDASAIAIDDSSLGYAPLGSFDRVETTLVADASGAPVDPVQLAPPITGFGITNPVPTVVADISQAGLLQLDDPISSIRVRVAGVEGGYTQQNIQRVTEVGQRLVDAGFTVTMAAGSSRQDVPIELGGWAFGVSPDALAQAEASGTDAVQTVGALGTVEQRWPSIGAAQRVEAAVVSSTIGVLALAIGAATLLFGVVQLAGVGPRHRDAALLARIGWRRSRIARRFAAEDAVTLGVLAVAGLGAIGLMATQSIGNVDASTPWIVGGALAVAVVIAGGALAVSVPALHATPAPPRALAGGKHAPVPTPRALATSTVGFGIGQARLHLGHALTVLTALVLIGLATAGAWTVVQQGIAAAGRTELADASSAQALIVQALLAAIGIVSGVVLVVLARRLDARLRAGQWRALHAMGWGSRRIWGARAVELVTVGVPAILLAAVIAWFGAPLAGVEDPMPIALAALAALLALLLLLALQRTDRSSARASRRARPTESAAAEPASTEGRP
ncbi:hypothetical protein [Agrococcus sp. KRD186]|uniref:hypothetical protein n=1 Tax=Agrococcus sp. KRD186 TaxID=2729730 RepID=UPI0019CFE7CA|nr:hypothetical protein [Agrococcus sp. KRD186]